MLKTPNDIATQLRSLLPPEKKEASWGFLAEQFPWYSILHMLRAADHPDDPDLLQKAALYHPDLLRLNIWLQLKETSDQVNIGNYNPGNEEIETVQEGTCIQEPIISAKDEAAGQQEESPQIDISRVDIPINNHASGVESSISENESPARDPLEELIQITPYHTIDYFASQGIKAERPGGPEESTPLDRQVKSFTDWLKTMKKLKFQPVTTYTDPLVEAKAKASIHQKEIVTEAMAEVWAKQGDLDHAAQIYAKLMLLHPEKTPYFAARLKELKEKQ